MALGSESEIKIMKLILSSVKVRVLENSNLLKLKILSLISKIVWLTRKIFSL